MHRITSVALVAGLALLGSCTASTSQKPSVTAQSRAPSGPASPINPASPIKSASGRNCVQLTQIRETRVVDDRTIDFILRDRTVLRNTLPYACPNLGFERAFSYATSLSELCNVDIITVINNGGGPRIGASCGLGNFVPYTPIPAAR